MDSVEELSPKDGRMEGKMAIALRILAKNYPISKIADIFGITEEQVRAL